MDKNTRDKEIIYQILKYCSEIERTHNIFGKSKALFFDADNGFVYRNSISMPILQIGELVKRLSEDFKVKNYDIPWKQIARMRDYFAHHYGSMDYNIIWKTSINDIYELNVYLENVIQQENIKYVGSLPNTELKTVADKVAMMSEWAEKAIIKAQMGQDKSDITHEDDTEQPSGDEL